MLNQQQSQSLVDQMKLEIAQELGIELNESTSDRDCGRVGGQIVKRLIELGKQSAEQNQLH